MNVCYLQGINVGCSDKITTSFYLPKFANSKIKRHIIQTERIFRVFAECLSSFRESVSKNFDAAGDVFKCVILMIMNPNRLFYAIFFNCLVIRRLNWPR